MSYIKWQINLQEILHVYCIYLHTIRIKNTIPIIPQFPVTLFARGAKYPKGNNEFHKQSFKWRNTRKYFYVHFHYILYKHTTARYESSSKASCYGITTTSVKFLFKILSSKWFCVFLRGGKTFENILMRCSPLVRYWKVQLLKSLCVFIKTFALLRVHFSKP